MKTFNPLLFLCLFAILPQAADANWDYDLLSMPDEYLPDDEPGIAWEETRLCAAIDSNGLPHLVFNYLKDSGVGIGMTFVHAWHDGENWQKESFEPTGSVWYPQSMCLTQSDEPVVLYIYRDTEGSGELEFGLTILKDGEWESQPLPGNYSYALRYQHAYQLYADESGLYLFYYISDDELFYVSHYDPQANSWDVRAIEGEWADYDIYETFQTTGGISILTPDTFGMLALVEDAALPSTHVILIESSEFSAIPTGCRSMLYNAKLQLVDNDEDGQLDKILYLDDASGELGVEGGTSLFAYESGSWEKLVDTGELGHHSTPGLLTGMLCHDVRNDTIYFSLLKKDGFDASYVYQYNADGTLLRTEVAFSPYQNVDVFYQMGPYSLCDEGQCYLYNLQSVRHPLAFPESFVGDGSNGPVFAKRSGTSYGFPTAPEVSNLSVSQRAGTKLVDISYTLQDADSESVSVSVVLSDDEGFTYTVPLASLSGDVGTVSTAGSTSYNYSIVWDAGADRSGIQRDSMRIKIQATD